MSVVEVAMSQSLVQKAPLSGVRTSHSENKKKKKIQVDWRKNIYSEVTKIFTTPGELELVLASS